MITQKEIESFLSLFKKTPNSSLLHISKNCSDIESTIENFTNTIDGKLTYKAFSTLNLERFRLTAREFEYAIISNCLDEIVDKGKFIQEVYHSLENSANIILIENKKNNNIATMVDLLDNNDFRATNAIDIFEDYHLVIAKKMHMWGNGL